MLRLRRSRMEDMEMVLSWRNSPEVARFMYRDEFIPFEEHRGWFPATCEDRPGERYRVVEYDSEPIGWISLTRIDFRSRTCEWGGYLAPSAQRQGGLGKAMLNASLKMAFQDLSLNRVAVEVLAGNDRALGLYESVGFVREGVLRERAWHSSGPQDVIVLSILSREFSHLADE